MPDSSAIVQKVWNYAHVLKNAGGGYGDYVEQITYLLFLQFAEDRVSR
ncbi:MAG: type I restriction enzyme M protein [Candidatus Binatia bacterium]|jgi:type I restriction enzyme M protein